MGRGLETDVERIAAEKAPQVAQQLRAVAGRGGTEADFRREAARVLAEVADSVGLNISPRDEYHVARGNVDSVYNRLILEYKRPGLLRPRNSAQANRSAISQIRKYIEDVAIRDRREAGRLAGIVTDGFHLIIVRRIGEAWTEDEVMPVNRASAELVLRLLFSLAVGVALIPENLVEDFGPRQWRAKSAVRAIYRGFSSSNAPLVTKLFDQWRIFFSEATDYSKWAERIESKPEFREFVASLWTREEIGRLDAARVFFVLHTYYALLIKLVASLVAARFANGRISPLSSLAAKEGEDLRVALVDLERGGLFRHYGIRNFLEGDFFGWYLTAWNADIEDAVSKMIARLAQYDPGALELAPENARDLLKKLYHLLLPREIRHDLGEYYTPDWLAERLVRQTLGEADLGDASKRVLDPACGSGTFLVILIKYIKERAARNRQAPSRTLDLILRNVVGFDLNPLAVIAARTNYLIALGDLLKDRGERQIDIPVYQADSILAPAEGSTLFEGDTYPLKTSVGTFRVPAAFAERERIDALANVLDESVESEFGEDAFLALLFQAAGLDAAAGQAVEQETRALYRQLRELHDEGINGVWARIIKNAFAPVFLEPCHYVVGNPPWVNWEHLPEQYRANTVPLWHHYGMVGEGGLNSIMGKVKMDISMLMTYVCADRYLRRGGKLGLVLSQSLFKTSAAGQRFRRFLLPDGTPFGPFVVEDMVELKPFEGAANRTVVAVFGKGHQVRYPVPYSRWQKRSDGPRGSIPFDLPYEQVTKERITFRSWQAEPIDRKNAKSAWITARGQALRALRKVLGISDYVAREGSNTGGANAVFWVQIVGTRPGRISMVVNVTEGAKRLTTQVQAAIETDLLYPLLRGRDVGRWRAVPSHHIVATRRPRSAERVIPEKSFQTDYPKAFAYFKRFEDQLRKRKDSVLARAMANGAPTYSMAIGKYVFAPWKVVWREQSEFLTAAVIGKYGQKPIIPDHKLMLVEVGSEQEAHYLCAVLNSSPAQLIVIAYSVEVSIGTHVLQNVGIPRFSARSAVHTRLSELSMAAHRATAAGKDVAKIEEGVDEAAAELWGLSTRDLREIRDSLKEA